MGSHIRFFGILVALVAAASFSVSQAEAQTVPSTDAQPFVGEWAVAVDAQGQTFTMDVSIEDASGNLAAEVGSEMGGTETVSRISKSGDSLVLTYSMDAQGQEVPVQLTLTPDGEGLNARVDFANGMFQTTGKGTRK